MKIELTIDDSLYEDIKVFCEYRGTDAGAYVSGLVADGHNTAKYGAAPAMFTPRVAKAAAESAGPKRTVEPKTPEREPEPPEKASEPLERAPRGKAGANDEETEKPKRKRKTLSAK